MSIWPFGSRGQSKPERKAPQPSPSQPGAGEKNPASGGGTVARRLSKTSRRRSSSVRSPVQPQSPRRTATSTVAPALDALDESEKPPLATDPKPIEEKENSAPTVPPGEVPPPLEPIAPGSPMDVDFAQQRRPSTGGSMRAERITALPGTRALLSSPHLRPVTQETADVPYNWALKSGSHSSLPNQANQQKRNKLQRSSSRNKRSAQYDSPLARRRSSKKRRNDPAREEEIRAMSRPIDVPARRAGTDTGLLRRESKKARGGLNRNLERPVSTVSLPFEESIHSSMSGEAEPRNYRVSLLHVISPRPTIRRRDMSKTYNNDTASSNLLRKASRSDRPSGKPVQTWRPTNEEKKARERARIDSLADDMDSTELRDILERDRKRQEKKQERDVERLQRKLERRAEKQRTKEWLAQQEKAGVVAETAARPTAPIRKEVGTQMAEEPDFHMEDVDTRDPFVDPKGQEQEQAQVDPFKDPERTASIPAENIHPALRTPKQQKQAKAVLGEPVTVIPQMPFGGDANDDDAISRRDIATPGSDVRTPQETPAIDTAQAVSYTAARPVTPLSPITSTVYHGDRAKASKILGADVAQGSYTVTNTVLDDASRPKDAQVTTPLVIPAAAEAAKKDPEVPLSASKKKSGFLASLFRSHRKSVSESPREAPASEPSFSNTSREEMSRNLPSYLVHQSSSATSFRKAGPPLRTQSIFREDLPESPLSPPDSRVQSPVDQSVRGGRYTRKQNRIPSAIMSEGSGRVGSPENDDERPGSPLSGKASQIMAHSLASVDSEASWLSGGRHRSGSAARKHASGSFISHGQHFNGSYEELGVPEDEYFRRLNTSSRGEQQASGLTAALAGSRHASSTVLRSPTIPPQTEEPNVKEPGQLISHVGASRQPTVVHRADTRHKSSEGLLNTFNSQVSAATAQQEDNDRTPEAEYPTPAETPIEERSSSDEAMTPVQRATSVNLGKGHARNMSAGSAKLLDIPRRGSRGDIVDLMAGSPGQPATPVRSQVTLSEEKKKEEDA